MLIQKLYKASNLLALIITLSLVISPIVRAEDPIYEDVSTAVNEDNTNITFSTPKLKPNGTDNTKVSFKLTNSENVALLDDYYDVSIKSSNGSITPAILGTDGIYTSTFTTPTSGTESIIDVEIKYMYYACDYVEAAFYDFNDDDELFYDEAGFSIVNTKINQLVRNLTNEELDEIIYEQGQNASGLEDWTPDDRQGFTDFYYDLVVNLQCYKPGEITKLSETISYIDTVITPAPTPAPITPTPTTVKSVIKEELKTYTTRTGGIRDGFIVTSVVSMLITTLFILKNKKN
jgi:hypothetical protein